MLGIEVTKAISSSPIPTYSRIVTEHLQRGHTEQIWNTLISETADYYYRRWPSINQQIHYKTIGQKVFAVYPSISLQGTKPWVSFYF